MKTMRKGFYLVGAWMLTMMFITVSCDTEDDVYESGEGYSTAYKDGSEGSSGSGENGSGNQEGNTDAGIVTAGEWCDLTHWDFWSRLMLGNDFSDKSSYWEFYTDNRIPVQVTDSEGNAVAGVKVKLLSENDGKTTTIWEAMTDNHGKAECWYGLFQKATADASKLRISLNDDVMDGNPVVCPLDSLSQGVKVNQYVYNKAKEVSQQADIAFVVDATGSMGDEIEFLKSDLKDIISKAKSARPGMKMRTAALFYRDEGDEYLTRPFNFTDNLSKTVDFIDKQKADGGNDYPEAVHTALTSMLQDLNWDSNARTRIAFLILDAPAHHETVIIRLLQQAMRECAKQGIRLIPVAASGTDKNTEFMLRFFAVTTGGTYVFLTDHSGVGYSHIAASVGNYEVELLNKLLIRLIEYYTE